MPTEVPESDRGSGPALRYTVEELQYGPWSEAMVEAQSRARQKYGPQTNVFLITPNDGDDGLGDFGLRVEPGNGTPAFERDVKGHSGDHYPASWGEKQVKREFLARSARSLAAIKFAPSTPSGLRRE